MIGCSKPLEEWPDRVRSLGFVGILFWHIVFSCFLSMNLNQNQCLIAAAPIVFSRSNDLCRHSPYLRLGFIRPHSRTRESTPHSIRRVRPSRWKNRQECGVIPTSTYFLASQKPRTRKGRMHLLAWLVVMPVTQSPRQNQLDHFGRPATITCGTLSVCCYFYTSYPSLLHSSSSQGGHLSEQVQEPNGDTGPGPEGCSSHAVKNPTVDRLRGI